MPPRSLLRSFLALWFVTGIALFIASAMTVVGARAGARHANPHIVLLGAIEALGALLFLVPRTMRLGAIVLLATIGIAFAVHSALGEIRGDLLVYAAAVAFTTVHGALTGPQWRAAMGGDA
jgi:membrane protein CcdC involved in cytochrome C biogenesis